MNPYLINSQANRPNIFKKLNLDVSINCIKIEKNNLKGKKLNMKN